MLLAATADRRAGGGRNAAPDSAVTADGSRWTASLRFSGAVHDLGSGHGGVQTIDLDVMPASAAVGGYVAGPIHHAQ